MRTKITQRVAETAAPAEKPYEILDADLKGLILRVQPSGAKSFIVTWGRGKRKTLGRYPVMTASGARAAALSALSESAEHGAPLSVIQAAKPNGGRPLTLRQFLGAGGQYSVWASQNITRHEENTRRVARVFEPLLDLPIEAIEKSEVERLLSELIASGRTPATANRAQASLRGILKKAVDWKILGGHPLQGMSIAKVTTGNVVRYLSAAENKCLRQSLQDREDERRKRRESGNAWIAARDYGDGREVWPDWGYTDHLMPIVLLALNTGMRRGEIFGLRWERVNFDLRVLVVAADTAKSGKARHIPLNAEAHDVLERWSKQTGSTGLVFSGATGALQTIKKSWAGILKRANIENFRFHDLRHDFASNLVMKGVDLNTVRELLGHSELEMTMRYAHLSPRTLANAVALLN